MCRVNVLNTGCRRVCLLHLPILVRSRGSIIVNLSSPPIYETLKHDCLLSLCSGYQELDFTDLAKICPANVGQNVGGVAPARVNYMRDDYFNC
jgi:hypothetical protein